MTTSYNDWPAPIPLGAFIPPEWPRDIFPDNIQKFVDALARSTETPIELSAMTTLSGISAAAQGKYIVQLKSDYYEPVNLWTAVALPPGSRKTAVQKAVTAPLSDWERLKKEEIQPLADRIASENKSLEARIKEMRRLAAAAEVGQYEKLKEQIVLLEGSLKKIPVIPQLWTADITPENLGTIMAENGERMAVLSDEAGIFDILSGRYSSGIPNLDLFLQAHAGSPVRVNRGSRPPVFLDHPALTVGLTPQPDILNGLSKTPAFRGRGLLARFLFAIPLSNLGARHLNAEPLDEAFKLAYHEVISAILHHAIFEGKPHKLNVSLDAFRDWHAYALSVEIRMGEDGPFAHMRDWAGKLPGAIGRIAGLLHIGKHAYSRPQAFEISKEEMGSAIKIGHVLADHAMAAFDLMGADAALEGARVILKWIIRNRWQGFTFRDCHYAHKSRFKRAKDMEPSVEVLEERHYIRTTGKEKKDGRPSRFYDVNLQIYENETRQG